MLTSLLGPSRTTPNARRADRSPFSSPFTIAFSPETNRRPTHNERRRPAADFDASGDTGDESNTNAEEDDDVAEEEEEEEDEGDEDEDEDEEDDADEDGPGEITPLLPIFSAALLGRIVMPAHK